MSTPVLAILFVHTMMMMVMFGVCDGKKFTVVARASVEGKNSNAVCGAIYTTEGLGYIARGGEIVSIPVDGDKCYKCGPCTYPTGMVCTRTDGECPSPSRPSERLEQRLGKGRAIISIDESNPADEVYTGILDPKARPGEYKIEPAAPIAHMSPDFLRNFASGESGAISASGDLIASGAFSGDESGGSARNEKTREGSG